MINYRDLGWWDAWVIALRSFLCRDFREKTDASEEHGPFCVMTPGLTRGRSSISGVYPSEQI